MNVEWISSMEDLTEKCFEPRPFNYSNDQDEGLFEKNQALSVLRNDIMILNLTARKLDKTSIHPNSSQSNKGVLKITVSDTGLGILEEDLGKLFQKFTQLQHDPSLRKLGTGLGLFITKELCKRMNGEIRVYSQRDKGCAFTICLLTEPVMNQTPLLLDLERTEDIIKRKGVKAMVVDDQIFSMNVLKNFLGKLNVEIMDTAENGLDAYSKFLSSVQRKTRIDLITMDLDMPIMDGKTSAQKIRELEHEKKLTPCIILIVSGNCGESEINECIDKKGKIRADAFLKKPVGVDELGRNILFHLIKQSGYRSSERNLTI